MLKYIEKSGPEGAVDPATKRLEENIRKIKMDPELRRSIMTFGDIIDSERREAIEETEKRVTLDSILSVISAFGEVPNELKARLKRIKDMELLKSLIPEAARAGSAEAFLKVLDEKMIL